jgi:hypothetical protein
LKIVCLLHTLLKTIQEWIGGELASDRIVRQVGAREIYAVASTTNSMTIVSEALPNLDNDVRRNTPRKNDRRHVSHVA